MIPEEWLKKLAEKILTEEEKKLIESLGGWDKREYRNRDDTVELGTRKIKVALKRLRRFARLGSPEELDLDDTTGGLFRTEANRGMNQVLAAVGG